METHRMAAAGTPVDNGDDGPLAEGKEKKKHRKKNKSPAAAVTDGRVDGAAAAGVGDAEGQDGDDSPVVKPKKDKKDRKHKKNTTKDDGESGRGEVNVNGEVAAAAAAVSGEQDGADAPGAPSGPSEEKPKGKDDADGVVSDRTEEEEGEDEEGGDEREGNEDVKEVKHRSRKETKEHDGERYLQEVYDSPTLVQDLIKFLRVGTVMLKHGRNGKPHRRLFWVSTARGRKELLWMEPNARNSDRSSIQLDAVSYIQLGSFSKVFKRHPIYPSDPAFFRCFTVGLKSGGRTVDIVADTMPDFEAWVVGLSHLVGVDPAWGGKLDVTREPGFDRLTFFESGLCETNYIFPSDYLTLKKAIQRKAAKALHTLEQCGNDAAKAHELLGGIHPPAINDKGALYFTKGEMRFLLPSLGLDIFRLSRVWMLLQQMNLIYDDKFIPATAFGVTRRE